MSTKQRRPRQPPTVEPGSTEIIVCHTPAVSARDMHLCAVRVQERLVNALQVPVWKEIQKAAERGQFECELWMDSLVRGIDAEVCPIEVARSLARIFGQLGFHAVADKDDRRHLGSMISAPKLTITWREVKL